MRYLLLLSVLATVAVADLTNPIVDAKPGRTARYSCHMSGPTRVDTAVLSVRLISRDATSFTVEETLDRGVAGITKARSTYPLARKMTDHVAALYKRQGFAEFVVTSSRATPGHRHDIDGTAYLCDRLSVSFTAVYKGKTVKGDLVYDLDKTAGPLGIVVFSADIAYQIGPDRWTQLQRLQMRLAPTPAPAKEAPRK